MQTHLQRKLSDLLLARMQREVIAVKRAACYQQKGGGEGTKAGKECVLFCGINSSSQGDNQPGILPDGALLGVSPLIDPYLSQCELEWS